MNKTLRRLEIHRLLLEGLNSREISQKLGISKRTVENHIMRLYREYSVVSIQELLVKRIKFLNRFIASMWEVL